MRYRRIWLAGRKRHFLTGALFRKSKQFTVATREHSESNFALRVAVAPMLIFSVEAFQRSNFLQLFRERCCRALASYCFCQLLHIDALRLLSCHVRELRLQSLNLILLLFDNLL